MHFSDVKGYDKHVNVSTSASIDRPAKAIAKQIKRKILDGEYPDWFERAKARIESSVSHTTGRALAAKDLSDKFDFLSMPRNSGSEHADRFNCYDIRVNSGSPSALHGVEVTGPDNVQLKLYSLTPLQAAAIIRVLSQ